MTLWIGLKALHVVAALAFVSGLLMVSLALAVLRHAPVQPGLHERQLALALCRWDRQVTTPALALLWALGLASHGGWWVAGWLQAKLVLVVGLSALHGILAGRLRRLAGAHGGPQPSRLRWASTATLAATGLIVVLVVGKPF